MSGFPRSFHTIRAEQLQLVDPATGETTPIYMQQNPFLGGEWIRVPQTMGIDVIYAAGVQTQSFGVNINVITDSSYTPTVLDCVLIFNGTTTQTLNLPTYGSNVEIICKLSPSSVLLNIVPPPGGTINGGNPGGITVTNQYGIALCFSDSSGYNWYIQRGLL